MVIDKYIEEAEDYLVEVINPIYDEYAKTKDSKIIKGLDEKLEVLQLKIDKIYELDENEGEHFYLTKVGTLPVEEVLLEDN